jgi:pyruvate dehydrogenase E2 component (dihydrolipoamide acetyltransferase)
MTHRIDIFVPDFGDFSDIPIVEIPVSIGDVLAPDDTVLVLESDKATLDVPAQHGGLVVEILVKVGDTVSKGTLVARVEAAASAFVDVEPMPSPSVGTFAAAIVAVLSDTPAPAAQPASSPLVYASPSIRRYARILGVSVAEVDGSGPKGRILRDDVESFVKGKLSDATASTAAAQPRQLPFDLPAWPTVDFAKFGPVERVPLSRIAKFSGPALTRNAIFIPHVCNFDKSDVTDLEAFRKILNVEARENDPKITLLAFTVKAVVAALKAYPKFNSALENDELVLRKYWNIGVAADTPDGLIVPVIRDVDAKGVAQIAGEMSELAAKGRAGKLSPAEMSGATFTISSLGGIGGTGFTPIINAPEVAILGMARAEIQPVWDETSFQPRLIQPLCLSWDHRVVDGVAAARFLQHISRSLGDFRRISI